MCAHMTHTNNEHLDHVHEYTLYVPIQHVRENINRLGIVAHSLISICGRGRHGDNELKASLSSMRLSQNKPTDKREHMNIPMIYTSYCVPYMHTYSTQNSA